MTTSALDVALPRHGGAGARMRARAHLGTELRSSSGGPARSCISTLHSEAPLILRVARAKAPEPWVRDVTDVVRVALTAGAAGPVGGDELSMTVEVGAGSSLVLSEISPTLLLPGPHGEPSSTRTQIRVAAGGTMIWLPEPMIAPADVNQRTGPAAVDGGGTVRHRPRRFGVCASALPAAVLLALLVRPSRSTLLAAFAALLLVCLLFFVISTHLLRAVLHRWHGG